MSDPFLSFAPSGGSAQEDRLRLFQSVERAVEALAAESDGLSVIVIGLPRRLCGEANEQTAAVEQLAARLGRHTAVPIVLQDERLTSREAESRLAVTEKNWRVRKRRLDAAAAAIILQDYLDSRQRERDSALAVEPEV